MFFRSFKDGTVAEVLGRSIERASSFAGRSRSEQWRSEVELEALVVIRLLVLALGFLAVGIISILRVAFEFDL